jgi:hypothetical protein
MINVMTTYQPVVQACCTPYTARQERRAHRIIFVGLAKHEIAPWWWFLREPKHVGVTVGILIVLIFLWFYNCVNQFGIIKKCLILLIHGTIMKITELYLGGPGFYHPPRYRLLWLRFIDLFLSFSTRMLTHYIANFQSIVLVSDKIVT